MNLSLPLLALVVLFLTVPAALSAPAPASRSLERSTPIPRAFTAPYSRVVVNPFMTVPPLADDGISADLAVYAGEQAIRLPSAWTWQAAAPAGLLEGPKVPLTSTACDAVDVTPAFEANGARVVLDDAAYGSLIARVTVDLDRTPYLALNVDDVTGAWALKVTPDETDSRDESSDIALRTDTSETGPQVVNVRRATGWTGTKTFRARLYVVGGKGRAARFSNMRFLGPASAVDRLRVTASTWAPDRLTTRAVASGGRAVEARVTLAGEGTVWQTVRVRGGAPSTMVLVGQWPRGSGNRVTHDSATGGVRLEGRGLRGHIRFSRPVRWLGVYPDWTDYLAQKGSDSGAGGVWAIALDGVSSGDEIVLRADFAPSGVAAPEEGPAPTVAACRSVFRASEAEWNARLARAPRPLSFVLRHAEPKGVTTEALQRNYYEAWAFVFADILPPMPENGYPYPQVACGKPSLWGEGHPRARASAQWESIIGMQFLALAEPDPAWRALEGMMTLVDADGSMNGEGLPSWHMQTAWTLYALTGDADRLRAIYPDMKRLLRWKAADPRWIHKGATREGTKDAEFVIHALLDMDYATRIARALGLSDDVEMWEAQRKALSADYRKWFFAPPGHTAYRIYDANTGERRDPNNSWSLPGIALPLEDIGAEGRDALLHLFDLLNGEEDTFLFPNFSKYPHYGLTARGLWRYGRPDDLLLMTDTYRRDVVRGGVFAEQYIQEDPPVPDGVRPSLFGALIAIEGAFWRNGVTIAEGYPALAKIPGAVGVENLHVRGKALNVRFGSRADVTLSGPALSILERPASFKESAGVWRGPLPDTGLVVLRPPVRSK